MMDDPCHYSLRLCLKECYVFVGLLRGLGSA